MAMVPVQFISIILYMILLNIHLYPIIPLINAVGHFTSSDCDWSIPSLGPIRMKHRPESPWWL